MSEALKVDLRDLPSVDDVLRTATAAVAIGEYGRQAVVAAIREALASVRQRRPTGISDAESIAKTALAQLESEAVPGLRPVFNLTGTILHTNLGRAILAAEAAEAALAAMRSAVALEFDLESGRRGERDDHLRKLVMELTGAEDATVVNNNAAAILLVLNTLAKGKEAIVSRGELIEIGGAFRLPEVMRRAGARLVEIGTTNRTHAKDYLAALGPRTGLILKVHTSNYRIQGFTAEVSAREIAALAHEHGVPVVHDLGSGTMADLARFGLKHEPTVTEAVANGADLVTFSGDKLLGGPQAGFIIGRKDVLARINRNPMKRALRVDKIRLAALEATLKLYRDPDRIAERLPALRLIARPYKEILALAQRLGPVIAARVGERYVVEVISCNSEVGSGACPLESISSAGLAIRPARARGKGRTLKALAASFRRLPIPVIGHISEDSFVLDLRCLEDEQSFAANLNGLDLARRDDELA